MSTSTRSRAPMLAVCALIIAVLAQTAASQPILPAPSPVYQTQPIVGITTHLAQPVDAALLAQIIGSVQAHHTNSIAARAPFAELYVTPVGRDARWQFGITAVPAPDVEHAVPDSYLYLARYRPNRHTWQVAAEFTPLFFRLLRNVPAEVMDPRTRAMYLSYEMQMTPGFAAPQGDGTALLSLPYPLGETQRMTGGPHVSGFNNSGVWNALDFAEGSGWAYAAREGSAYVPCTNLVRVDHFSSPAISTGYYHLTNTQFSSGDWVNRYQTLGQQSTGVGCGGSATGAHTHFFVRYPGGYLGFGGSPALSSLDIGGWTPQNGSAEYNGCMVRVVDGAQVCQWGYIRNDGVEGTGLIPASTNVARNGSFGSGLNDWNLWGEIVASTPGGVLNIHRASPSPQGAAIWQRLNYSAQTNTALELRFLAGNSSGATKTLHAHLHHHDHWDDPMSCVFTIPPNTALQEYVVRGRNASPWHNIALEFTPDPADGMAAILIDDVSVVQRTDITPTVTECVGGSAFSIGENAGAGWDAPNAAYWTAQFNETYNLIVPTKGYSGIIAVSDASTGVQQFSAQHESGTVEFWLVANPELRRVFFVGPSAVSWMHGVFPTDRVVYVDETWSGLQLKGAPTSDAMVYSGTPRICFSNGCVDAPEGGSPSFSGWPGVAADQWRADFFNQLDHYAGSYGWVENLVVPGSGFTMDWNTSAPTTMMRADFFSAHYWRSVQVAGGTYRFTASADDHLRIGVRVHQTGDYVPVVEVGTGQAPQTGEIHLPFGTHTIGLWYYEHTGPAGFNWSMEAVPVTNLLVNGGFETAGVPAANWSGTALTGDKRVCNAPGVAPVAHEGTCAFLFKGGPAGASSIQQNPGQALLAGDVVTFSGYVRGKNLSGGGRVEIKATLENGTKQRQRLALPTGTYDYQPFSLSLTTAMNATKVVVIVQMSGTAGKFYLDDLMLAR